MSTTEAVVVIAIVMLTVGIPLAGLTLRMTLKPLIDAYARLREAHLGIGVDQAELALLRDRVKALERQLHSLEAPKSRDPLSSRV